MGVCAGGGCGVVWARMGLPMMAEERLVNLCGVVSGDNGLVATVWEKRS